MADRNERYDPDLSKDIETLEKLYFQETEPGEPEPTMKPAAKRQTGSRSTPRRKSASNASRARQTKTTEKKESSGKTRKNPFAGRAEKTRTPKKKSRTAQKAANAAAPQTDPDKLVFTPLPPEGYAEPAAENQTAARASALASEAT
ncbi:MAG: hypothetical protein J5847_05135, partial [Clostridia bacterium]|nr:hypothetical protein [Clostridia bacterium]